LACAGGAGTRRIVDDPGDDVSILRAWRIGAVPFRVAAAVQEPRQRYPLRPLEEVFCRPALPPMPASDRPNRATCKSSNRQLAVNASDSDSTDLDALIGHGHAENTRPTNDLTLRCQELAAEVSGLARMANEDADSAIAAAANRIFIDTMCGSECANLDTVRRLFVVLPEDHNTRCFGLGVLHFHALQVGLGC
jgi:hypothetical protein